MSIQKIIQRCLLLGIVMLLCGVTIIDASEGRCRSKSLASSGNSSRQKNKSYSAESDFSITVEQEPLYQRQIQELEKQVQLLQGQVSLKNVQLGEIEKSHEQQLNYFIKTRQEAEEEYKEKIVQQESEIFSLKLQLITNTAAIEQKQAYTHEKLQKEIAKNTQALQQQLARLEKGIDAKEKQYKKELMQSKSTKCENSTFCHRMIIVALLSGLLLLVLDKYGVTFV